LQAQEREQGKEVTMATEEIPPGARWRARIRYVDNSSDCMVFDEFAELGRSIELGPDWNLIVSIHVTLTRQTPIGAERVDKDL
jgi:hypothetical protein